MHKIMILIIHLYLWYKKNLNNYELLDIMNNIFNNNEKLKVDEINEIFENLFSISKIKKKSKMITFKEVYDILKNNEFSKINVPFELNYYDENKNQKFIKSNPFKKIKINEKFVTEQGDYIPLYEYRLDSFSILSSKWNNNDNNKNIINYSISENILKIVENKLKDNIDEENKDDILFNGYLKQYFPYLNNLKKLMIIMMVMKKL